MQPWDHGFQVPSSQKEAAQRVAGHILPPSVCVCLAPSRQRERVVLPGCLQLRSENHPLNVSARRTSVLKSAG